MRQVWENNAPSAYLVRYLCPSSKSRHGTLRENPSMKTIIAGSRSIQNPIVLRRAVKQSGFSITEVVSGGAKGVDQLGEAWAKANFIALQRFPANWDAYGKGAGMIRNEQMANYADQLIAIWDGKSPGTGHMIGIMRQRGKPVFVLFV
jgi:YspA, cpYpsA-related SLOG family